MSSNNIEQLAYDISEKLTADEMASLITFFKLIQHGMNLAAVYQVEPLSVRGGMAVPDVPVEDIAPALSTTERASYQRSKSKAKVPSTLKAAPADDDSEDVF